LKLAEKAGHSPNLRKPVFGIFQDDRIFDREVLELFDESR